ncbi:MAG: TonB-dependent receptor [Bacteroides sp.]|nr:TonB-dependent receptor [Bacteroides sp.]
MALYVEDDWEISSRLKANAGFRYPLFQVEGKGYHGFDPRLSLRYLLTDRIALRAGYSDMKQYIHLLSSNTLVLQTDLWVPVTKKVKPMHSRQYAAGVFFQLPHTMEFSVETYYKGMENIIEYKDGASFTEFSGGWENQVEAGKGRSYGIEFSLQKRAGKSTGWLSYTLAATERLFDQINYVEWFPAKYDRRHNLAITLSRKLGDKVDVSGSWVYTTGSVITLPLIQVEQGEIPEDPFPEQVVVDQVDHRNNYRQDAYYRLDLGLNYYTSVKKTSLWNY